METSEGSQQAPVVRGYARDLRTGEERYFADQEGFLSSLYSRFERRDACAEKEMK